MDYETKTTHMLGAAIGAMSLYGGIIMGGSPSPNIQPLSHTAQTALHSWCQAITTTASYFQNLGMPSDLAGGTAAILGVVAPVAAGIAISNVGRMAIEIGKHGLSGGLKNYWESVSGKASRMGDPVVVTKVNSVFEQADAAIKLKGGGILGFMNERYYVRAADGEIKRATKAEYDEVRRDILKDKASVVIKNDNLLNYAKGKLASIVAFAKPVMSHDSVVVTARDVGSKAETKMSLSDFLTGKNGPSIEDPRRGYAR
jgi:hypothetical protein